MTQKEANAMTMTAVSFEAVQERPNYWDGVPVHRMPLSQRSGDWRMSHTRVAKEFPTIVQAERYARRILGQRPGVPVEIFRCGAHGKRDHVAAVSRDALGRTWTDLKTQEPLL
jgi:hypothetical protein